MNLQNQDEPDSLYECLAKLIVSRKTVPPGEALETVRRLAKPPTKKHDEIEKREKRLDLIRK